MDLSLSQEEVALLIQVLKDVHLPNLREEIGKTENADWRREMKNDEAMLTAIVGRLEQTATAHPA